MTQALPYWFLAALFIGLAFAILQLSTIGRYLMATQEDVDKLVVQVVKIGDEVKVAAASLKAELDDVKAQLAAAGATTKVDLTALAAAIQTVDDIHPDVVVEEPVEEPVEDPVVEDVADDEVPPN